MQGCKPAKKDRRGLLERHVDRLDRQGAILGQACVLGMSAEPEPGPPKYLIAHGVAGYGLTHRLDCSGELHPQYVDLLGPPKADHEPYEEWIGLSDPPVRRANRGGMDANQEFVVLGNRFFDILNVENVRRAVFGEDGGLHRQFTLRAAGSKDP